MPDAAAPYATPPPDQVTIPTRHGAGRTWLRVHDETVVGPSRLPMRLSDWQTTCAACGGAFTVRAPGWAVPRLGIGCWRLRNCPAHRLRRGKRARTTPP